MRKDVVVLVQNIRKSRSLQKELLQISLPKSTFITAESLAIVKRFLYTDEIR